MEIEKLNALAAGLASIDEAVSGYEFPDSLGEMFAQLFDVNEINILHLIDNEEYYQCKGEKDVLRILCIQAYQKILCKEKDFAKNRIISMLDAPIPSILLKECNANECLVDDTEIYKTLVLANEWLLENSYLEESIILFNFMNSLRDYNKHSCRMGYAIGHKYYRYLNVGLFGKVVGSEFTVGSFISEDKNELSIPKDMATEYDYIFHKTIEGNGNRGLAVAFVHSISGVVKADIFDFYIERINYGSFQFKGITHYSLIKTIDVDQNVELAAMMIAHEMNILAEEFRND